MSRNPNKINPPETSTPNKFPKQGSTPVRATWKAAIRSGFHQLSTKSDQKPGHKKRGIGQDFINKIIALVMNDTSRVASPLPYKPAQVYNGEKEWFVSFRYYSLSSHKYHRKKVFINEKNLSISERQNLLEQVKDLLNKEFAIRNKKLEYYSKSQPIQRNSDILRQCIVLASEDNDYTEDRRRTLCELLKNIDAFIVANPRYADIPITEVTDKVIKDFIKFLNTKKRAGKTINKYLWALEKVSEHAKRIGILNNVITTDHLRVKQPKNETGKYPPLTDREKTTAFNFYRDRLPGLYLFILHIYYTCIRPKELHRLKVKNFNFDNKTIYVPWQSSKNGLSNYVQILQPLYDALIENGIDKLDPELYLFGDTCTPSKTVYSKGKYATGRWSYYRRKFSSLPRKQMYGLKHTFNIDYIENNKKNIDWEWLRRHNRHATIQQTQDYISGLTAYFLDETKNIILNYHKQKPKRRL